MFRVSKFTIAEVPITQVGTTWTVDRKSSCLYLLAQANVPIEQVYNSRSIPITQVGTTWTVDRKSSCLYLLAQANVPIEQVYNSRSSDYPSRNNLDSRSEIFVSIFTGTSECSD